MNRTAICLVVVLSVLLAAGQQPSDKKTAAKNAPAKTAKAGASVPKATPGFDATALDRAADPCVDFYQFACGGWEKRTEIPPDQSRWGRFNELAERNRHVLREILERDAAPSAKRNPVQTQIGDFYAACMDEKAADANAAKPIEPLLARIDALKSLDELPALAADLHQRGLNALFGFGSEPDFADANQVIASIQQGGLSLPDRDYYLKDDPKSTTLRQAYVAHVQKMLSLAGEPPEQAAADAKSILAFETELAKVSLDRVSRREPKNVYHKMAKDEWLHMTRQFAFDRYLDGLHSPAFKEVNVSVPAFVKGMDDLLARTELPVLQTYLRWHVIHGTANWLSTPFVNEQFEFYGRTLTGAKEIQPRWKRCVALTDQMLGEGLGQEFVAQTFGPVARQRTHDMVLALERALRADIEQLDWMTPDTKKKAMEKLDAIANKIGYPEKWRDYSSVVVKRDDLVGNVERASAFEVRRDLNKIGKPLDRKEWGMTPPTVNAYYDPQMNNINFPAGILQPPFFDASADDAINFGGIGAVIGHELTHGFDDEGRKFDAEGNLKDWWTAKDGEEFDKRASCIADEYSGFVAVEDVHLNGKLTLGENTADNGGVRIALMALQDTAKNKKAAKIDGFTPDQRVFLGWAQIWCQKQTPQIARMLATVDPHSPGKYRVNGVVVNMPEFEKAWSCKPGQPMTPAKRCRVW